MLEAAVNAMTPSIYPEVLGSRGLTDADVIDLGGFESFVYRCDARRTIIRATHASHRTETQLLAELEWIEALAREGGPVSRPRRDGGGRLVNQVADFFVCEFDIAPGRLIEQADWTPPLFRSWGEALGLMHRHARSFVPDHRRDRWDTDDNFFIDGKVSPDQALVHQRMGEVHAALRKLPETEDVFGLIHCDAHAGNFFFDNDVLTFFDFDDACYCWYGYDAATVLFSAIRQPWTANTREAEVAEATDFLPSFLEGYSGQSDPQLLMPAAWPVFLALREIGLYGVISAHVIDLADDSNGYPRRFMEGRRARIEAGEPYLDMDLSTFF